MRTMGIVSLALLLLGEGSQLVAAEPSSSAPPSTRQPATHQLESSRPAPALSSRQRLTPLQTPAKLSSFAHAQPAAPEVTCQGFIARPGWDLGLPQRAGDYSLEVRLARGDFHALSCDLKVSGQSGGTRTLAAISGHGFWLSGLGRIVVVTAAESPALASLVRILDLDGRVLFNREALALTDPVLAGDGRTFVFRCREGTVALDVQSYRERIYEVLATFAAGPGGQIAGVPPAGNPQIVFHDGKGGRTAVALPVRPCKVTFADDGQSVLALGADRLLSLTVPITGAGAPSPVLLYRAPAGSELRDLVAIPEGIAVGQRRSDGGHFTGELVELDDAGRVLAVRTGPSLPIPGVPADMLPAAREDRDRTHESIPWPLQPNHQHPVGNTYGEYQNYGSSYLHPGVDVLGASHQSVYAVAAGVVKAILTTSADYHWRVAIGDPSTGTSEGYMYAHLDHGSIAVSVGQAITQGQYLGYLVTWPVAGFTHCHFARIQDTGAQWLGNWLNLDNPHLDFDNQSEFEPPVFEPARGNDLLAFCNNQTSTYQEPTSLHSAVDIIAHVGDRIEADWVCSVQELRYTIAPATDPGFHLVDNKLAVAFDMVLDTYQNGPIDPFLVNLLYKQDATCFTQGDYDNREFYHILTNSNGDQVYDEADLQEAWDTSLLPDGDYLISVIARDAKGNASSIAMTVTTANGNPTGIAPEPLLTAVSLRSYPNPGSVGAATSLQLPVGQRTRLTVYDLAGRQLATLLDGELPAGLHVVRWDGCDLSGRTVAGGTYLFRLDTPGGTRVEKFLLVR